MTEKQDRLYLYLASRNKYTIKLVAVLRGDITHSVVDDVKVLKLPTTVEQQIHKIMLEHRLEYEMKVDSCQSYSELVEILRHKGYKNIPMGPTPMLYFDDLAPVASTKSCKIVRTMLRKRRN